MVVGASAWLGSRGWGPAQEGDRLRLQLVDIIRAAQRPLPPLASHVARRLAGRDREVLTAELLSPFAPRPTPA
eukprot:1187173-Alexandrium_andersonii.AAC.1